MATAYPAANSTYVPSFEASGQLVIQYSRNPKSYALNRYSKLVQASKSIGYYLFIEPAQAYRILNSEGSEFVWHDGNDAPSGADNKQEFEYKPFMTTRFAFPAQLGYKTVEQADWKILVQYTNMVANQAMTNRTQKLLTAAVDSSNYPSNHVDTATNFGGGLWSAGTLTAPYIQKSLMTLANRILTTTGGAVEYSQLCVIVNPNLASAMARSAEIREYLAQSPAALAQVRGDVESQNGIYGLPDTLYGFKVTVEKAVKTTSKKGQTNSKSFILSDNNALVVARPGDLVGIEGANDFSTLTIFSYEEMTVETADDPNHRRKNLRVVDDFDAKVTAGYTGGYISNCLS